MNGAATERRGWARGKWLVVAAVILAVQAGFFCWPARRRSKPARELPVPLAMHLATGPVAEIPGYVDPLLLARADRHGFSEKAWLRIPPLTYHPGITNEPPRFLDPQPEGLGSALSGALSNELDQPYLVAQGPATGSDVPVYMPPADDPPIPSYLTIEGELAGRRLIKPPELKPQPADTILTNTVVEIVVDAEGRIFGPPTLAPVSVAAPADYANANADALAAAARLQFEPLPIGPGQSYPAPASHLSLGRLVFHWQTVPKPGPATNETSPLK
jgi:hypothetical protein